MSDANQATVDRPEPAPSDTGGGSPIHVILIVQGVVVASAVAAALFCLF